MDRKDVNKFCGRAPVVMSLLAFAVVLVAAATGWESGLHDEGAGAHIFQLLIIAEAPVVLVFLATANWSRALQVAGLVAVQAAALSVAIGFVAFFRM
jgi:hypothetical protein